MVIVSHWSTIHATLAPILLIVDYSWPLHCSGQNATFTFVIKMRKELAIYMQSSGVQCDKNRFVTVTYIIITDLSITSYNNVNRIDQYVCKQTVFSLSHNDKQ